MPLSVGSTPTSHDLANLINGVENMNDDERMMLIGIALAAFFTFAISMLYSMG